jgi:transposase-like protein
MSGARKKKEEMNGNSLSVLSSRPDTEVVAKPKRRTFTAEYKQRILTEAETAAATPGGVGALLRREGLYPSLLAYWRRERANGILEALTPQKRGPKSKRHPMEAENQKLRRQNARAEVLRKAHIIIDVPKKWLRCWVIRFRSRTRRSQSLRWMRLIYCTPLSHQSLHCDSKYLRYRLWLADRS